ncbi:hypothetical protein BLOT_014845 [Blomia tropicalis]|nr:hypothetical protein BLOT_014845 [Blomia tropicalis]
MAKRMSDNSLFRHDNGLCAQTAVRASRETKGQIEVDAQQPADTSTMMDNQSSEEENNCKE